MSISLSRAVGPFRVRPYVKNGAPTGKWFVDVPASLTSNGKRKRKLFDNQGSALAAAETLRNSIDEITGLVKVREETVSTTFGEAADGWLTDEELRVQTLKKRAGSLQVNRYRLNAARAFFGKDTLASITDRRLVEYQAARLKAGRKPVSINADMQTIRQVLKWAVKRRLIDAAPEVEAIPTRPVRVVVPTPEEVVRIIDHLPAYLKPLIHFLAETGCRRGEAVHLTWDCIDEIGGYAEIRSRDGWTPKTQSSERRILLSDGLLEVLRRLPKKGLYVFPGKTPDKPIGLFRKTWARAVRKANIVRGGRRVHVQVKTLRKAHATWQAERGTPESVLQDRLGHSKGSTVTRAFYVQTTDEARRAAVIELPLGEAALKSDRAASTLTPDDGEAVAAKA